MLQMLLWWSSGTTSMLVSAAVRLTSLRGRAVRHGFDCVPLGNLLIQLQLSGAEASSSKVRRAGRARRGKNLVSCWYLSYWFVPCCFLQVTAAPGHSSASPSTPPLR